MLGITQGIEYLKLLIQDFQDGVAPISEKGQKPIIWQDFCRKLHENKLHRRVPAPPLLRSANDFVLSSGPLDVQYVRP